MSTTTILLATAAPLGLALVVGGALYLTRAKQADRLEVWRANKPSALPRRKLSADYSDTSSWGMRTFLLRQAAKDAQRRAA